MNFADAQREIDSIQIMLKEAKESVPLGSDDPAVIELERMMIRKVGEFEVAKTEVRDAISFDNVLFAPDDNDDDEEPSFSSPLSTRSVRSR